MLANLQTRRLLYRNLFQPLVPAQSGEGLAADPLIERMGSKSEYFAVRQYRDIGTYSVRGLPRPEGDKYHGELSVSDPVYGVWAYRR